MNDAACSPHGRQTALGANCAHSMGWGSGDTDVQRGDVETDAVVDRGTYHLMVQHTLTKNTRVPSAELRA